MSSNKIWVQPSLKFDGKVRVHLGGYLFWCRQDQLLPLGNAIADYLSQEQEQP